MLALAAATAWASSQSEASAPKQLQKVNFQLNWKITGDHAPYYVAMDKGWFAEEGIEVNVILGQGSGYTVQALESGKAEIGISDAPVPIKMRAEGAKIRIVGILFDKHPNCMYFWKDSGITKPQDVAGKTVAVPAADGHKVMWPAFARLIGVDAASVKFVNIEPAAKVAALASKNADVVFELYTGKPFMEKAIPPAQLGYFIWADYGFNAYAHSLIARDEVIKNNPELVRKFLKAAYRGWDYTLKNPKEAISILAKHHPINEDRLPRQPHGGHGFLQDRPLQEQRHRLHRPRADERDHRPGQDLPGRGHPVRLRGDVHGGPPAQADVQVQLVDRSRRRPRGDLPLRPPPRGNPWPTGNRFFRSAA